jgi:alkylation response protein AidB-like acyl-CoA dehydrogenase
VNFGFTDEQELLRQEARKFLDQSCPMKEVRRIAETPEGGSPELWKRIAELGWTGLTVPEEHGGAGLGWVDLVVLLEETGRSLFPSPLLGHTLAAAALAEAGHQAQHERWLPALADGSRIGALAVLEASDRMDPAGVALQARQDTAGGWVLRGEKRFVLDAPAADLFVVAARTGPAPEAVSWFVVEGRAAGVTVTDTPGMDRTRRMGVLRLGDVAVPTEDLLGEPGGAWPSLTRVLDLATAAVTAEMIGAAEAAHALSVDFAKKRVQFGSPIGRFQGVKHPLAEMYVDLESVKSLLYYAAWALDEGHEDAPRAVSMAKAQASDAFARIGIDAVQLHGAVGYTWEYDVHLYLKRSKWARPMFGDAAWHHERVARLGGL